MARGEITRQEAKEIEARDAQIKEEIVELLKKGSEKGLDRERIEDEFGLVPLRAYALLLELEREGLIEERAGHYFIKE